MGTETLSRVDRNKSAEFNLLVGTKRTQLTRDQPIHETMAFDLKQMVKKSTAIRELLERAICAGLDGWLLLDDEWMVINGRYHVLMHPSYRLPALYILQQSPDTLSGSPVHTGMDLGVRQGLKLSMAEHPRLMMPCISVHPCDTHLIFLAGRDADQVEWTADLLLGWLSFQLSDYADLALLLV